jgi:hypothetical protein
MHLHHQLLQWRQELLHTSIILPAYSRRFHKLFLHTDSWSSVFNAPSIQIKASQKSVPYVSLHRTDIKYLILQYVYKSVFYMFINVTNFQGTCMNTAPFHVHLWKSSLLQTVLSLPNGPTIPITYLAHLTLFSYTTLPHVATCILTTVIKHAPISIKPLTPQTWNRQTWYYTFYIVFTVHFDNIQQLNQQIHFIS